MKCPVKAHGDHPLTLIHTQHGSMWECPVEGQRFVEVPKGTKPSDPNRVRHLKEGRRS